MITVVLALASAVAFALGVQLAWWRIGEADIGPFGTHRCFSGECAAKGLAWIQGSDLWIRSAIATRAAGYIAMLILLMFAAGRAAKREPTLIARGALSAIVTATVVGGYFLAAFPGIGGETPGPGMFCFAGAIIAGLAAIILFLRSAARAAR